MSRKQLLLKDILIEISFGAGVNWNRDDLYYETLDIAGAVRFAQAVQSRFNLPVLSLHHLKNFEDIDTLATWLVEFEPEILDRL